ncbi:MAG: hypothetical protein AUH28_06780 [Acidobacteria bacterium 13_1_40CM_56_16]|nr:MAG: hypothetical protein AUH28_06780 [Acidobacteria bacterium 13_1_40CM_56_16]
MQFFRQFSVVPSVVNGHCTRLIVVRVIVRLVQRLAAASYGGDSNSRWEGMGLGFWPAAVLTSAFFGYSHHANAGEDWIGLFNAGAVGLLFCLLLRRSGNLWMPIGFHLAFDWGETYLYGVPNSGHVLPGHLLSGSSSGAWWLSGGTVGPEGSVLCTLLLIAVWCVCARWLPRAQYPQDTKAELHA